MAKRPPTRSNQGISDTSHDTAFKEARAALAGADGAPAAVVLVDRDGRMRSTVRGPDKTAGAARGPLWFRIGSLTKTIVAFAALHHASATGHDPRADIAPELSRLIGGRFDGPVTLTALLSHTAGLHNCAALDDPAPTGLGADALRHDAARGCFSYSNVGFAIVGAWMHQRTGLAFDGWLASHALNPLGLSGVALRPPAGAPRATGHVTDPQSGQPTPIALAVADDRFAPAGFLWATIEGLGELIRTLLTPPDAAAARIVSQMMEAISPVFGPGALSAGSGLFGHWRGDHSIVFNEGEIGGFRSRIELDLGAGTGLAVSAAHSGPDNAGANTVLAGALPAAPPERAGPSDRTLLPAGAPTYLAPGLGLFQCEDPRTMRGARLNGVAATLRAVDSGLWQGRTEEGRPLIVCGGAGRDARDLTINGHLATASRLRVRRPRLDAHWFGRYHNGYWIDVTEAGDGDGTVRVASTYNGLSSRALVVGPRVLATDMGLAVFGARITRAELHLLGTAVFRRQHPAW